jgi:hypothetical protein
LHSRTGAVGVLTVVEVCSVLETECRVSRLELLPALEEADNLAVLGIRGHPVPGFGDSIGALALITAWSRLAMPRSGSGISAIFASTSFSSIGVAEG